MKIDVSSTLDRFKAGLVLDVQKIRQATAYTLTDTAWDVVWFVSDRMAVDFDRPTPFALKAFAARKATPENLEALVFAREFAGKGTSAEKYIAPNVFGGPRNARSSERKLRIHDYMLPDEFMVPGKDEPRDQYGNLPPTLYKRMLSQLQAMGGDVNQNETDRSRKRNKSRVRERYFVPDRQGTKLPPGIYRRTKISDKPVRYRIELVALFVKNPRYSKRFKYNETADKAIDARLPYHWEKKLAKALR